MARGPKHPGLQQRYESALIDLLGQERSLKAREILERIRSQAQRFAISNDECGDLEKNFANYTMRAKDAGVIVSGGPWGGYQLAVQTPPGPPPSSRVASTRPQQAATDAEPPGIRRRHWESLLHLPLTVALSAHFSARVLSLRNATDPVRWGNPDMLMIRPSLLSQLPDFDPDLDPDLFRKIDVTPECVLASIEVKGGLERDRAQLFTAIAEAAANSRWANEAWLAFVDWVRNDNGLDEDVVSLARSVEVGLLEVRVFEDLRTIVHHSAPSRATLRLGELTRERVGVLRAAQTLLTNWETGDATFLDVESAEQKARFLMEHAIQNLRAQKGFTALDSLPGLLKQLNADADDRDYVTKILQAALRSAAVASGVDTDADLGQVIALAGDASLVKNAADTLRGDLVAFGMTKLPKKS